MTGNWASALGALGGRYGRSRVRADKVQTVLSGPLPTSACVWISWHEFNLLTVALHVMMSPRSAMAIVPAGLRGTMMRGWLSVYGIEAEILNGDGQDTLTLRRMWRALKNNSDVMIAVDGPFGPRRDPRPGALWLAAASRVPAIPVGCAAEPAVRIPRWDRHLVPLPGARIAAVFGEPIRRDLDPRSPEAATHVRETLNDLSARAEAVLRRGEPAAVPGPEPKLPKRASLR